MSKINPKRSKQLKTEYAEFLKTDPIGASIYAINPFIRYINLIHITNVLDEIRYEIATNPKFDIRDERIAFQDVDDYEALSDPFMTMNLPEIQFACGVRVYKQSYNQYTMEIYTTDEYSNVSSVQAIENLTLSDIKWIVQALRYDDKRLYSETEEELSEVDRAIYSSTYGYKPKDILMRGSFPKSYGYDQFKKSLENKDEKLTEPVSQERLKQSLSDLPSRTQFKREREYEEDLPSPKRFKPLQTQL